VQAKDVSIKKQPIAKKDLFELITQKPKKHVNLAIRMMEILVGWNSEAIEIQ